MKHLTQIGLTVFVLLPYFHGSQLLAAPSKTTPAPKVVAAPKLTQITRDNFISFWWSYDRLQYDVGDLGRQNASFIVKGNTIRCELRNEDKTEFTADLSNNQVDALIKKLNKRQRNDEGKEHKDFPKVLFTLIFSDSNNKDKDDNFVFFDNDNAESNVELETYLHDLAQMKFPHLFYVPPVDPALPNADANNH